MKLALFGDYRVQRPVCAKRTDGERPPGFSGREQICLRWDRMILSLSAVSEAAAAEVVNGAQPGAFAIEASPRGVVRKARPDRAADRRRLEDRVPRVLPRRGLRHGCGAPCLRDARARCRVAASAVERLLLLWAMPARLQEKCLPSSSHFPGLVLTVCGGGAQVMGTPFFMGPRAKQ